ncbi:MAG: Mur ligase family protein [Brevinema sp.]
MNLLEKILSFSTVKQIPKEKYPYRVYNLLKELGFDPDRLKYIHITGSKGKGSLAYNTFHILKAQGYRVALFSSPHIFDVRERFVTEQGMISEADLQNLIICYQDFLKQKELHFFENCLFFALIYFLGQQCEYVVLEVGVGGRFDPTNFCRPLISLLGHISLEHRDLLGDTIEEIAFDKVGIIKKGIPALSVMQEKSVVAIINHQALFYDDIITIHNYIQEDGIQSFDLELFHKIMIPNIKLTRIGKAHLINFCLAVAGIFYILPDSPFQSIYRTALLPYPYRMDRVRDDLIIDTAHNGVSFENLLQGLKELSWDHIVLYLTILQGKEIQDISQVLIKYKTLIKRIEFFEFETHISRNSAVKPLYDLTKGEIESSYWEDIRMIQWDSVSKKVFAGSFYSVPVIKQIIPDR